MDRRAKLRTLFETRWASRADTLYTFRAAFPIVVQTLEILSQDGDGKVRGYLCSIKQFDFIIALFAAEHVLSNTVVLSTMLQGKSGDLIGAAQEVTVVINILKAEKSDPSVWKEVYEWGKQNAGEFDIVPCILRATKEGSHRVNVPATNPESYWQRAVYQPLIDHFIQANIFSQQNYKD